jgi:serine/threonine-protein kinase
MKTLNHRALLAAKAREREGEFEAAASEYLAADLPNEALRVLTSARLFAQGAWLFLSHYGIDPTATEHRDAQKRRHALTIAILFARGGEAKRAATLFTALGEHERASEVLKRAAFSASTPALSAKVESDEEGRFNSAVDAYIANGQFGSAGRLLEQRGRYREAVPLYAKAGLRYETALAALNARMLTEAFNALSRAPRDDSRYRTTCAAAIDAAIAADTLPLRLELFLSDFVSSGAKTALEGDRLYQLGLLYERKALFDNAGDALRQALLYDPRNDDAATHLRAVQRTLQARAAAQAAPALPSLLTPGNQLGSQSTTPHGPSKAAEGEATWRAMFRDGAVIAGRYRIEQRIGQGGMAVVFRATDLELSMEVALKAYLAVGDDVDEALTRFRRELRFTRSIVHENVVRVFDIGVFDGQRYITMELLRGQELGKRMKKPLPLVDALDVLIQSCRGLQAAHAQGIIHRDIKPGNLFVTNESVVKVMDFGIARSISGEADLTTTQFFAGTPTYIAPEQIVESRTVTFAADLYSLGVVAYRLLTGVTPFAHPEMYPLLMMHLNKPPDSLRDHNPMLSGELDAVILRCLEKLPERRWGSCNELAEVLGHLRDVEAKR